MVTSIGISFTYIVGQVNKTLKKGKKEKIYDELKITILDLKNFENNFLNKFFTVTLKNFPIASVML